MKTLLGKLDPRGGVAMRGHEVRIGYFDQKLSDLDEDHSLIDEVRTVRGDFNEDVARNFLGRFRFTGDDGFKKVKGLSGGERNRLTLAKMMLRPRNLLALDEPTNHLDIPAREVLEEALDEYEGTVIVVSHDRYFLDRVVTKIVHVHDGRAEEHVGNYTEWKARESRRSRPVAAPTEARSRSSRSPSREKHGAHRRAREEEGARARSREEAEADAGAGGRRSPAPRARSPRSTTSSRPTTAATGPSCTRSSPTRRKSSSG